MPMSANRIFILVIAFVAVLFGLSIAVGQRCSRPDFTGADLKQSWVNRLSAPAVDLTTLDPSPNELDPSSRRWTIKETASPATLKVPAASRFSSPVHRLKLTLARVDGGAKVTVTAAYEPAQQKDGSPIDAEARPFSSDLEKPLELVVLRNGGTITVSRKSGPTGPVVIELE